jgi:integrase
LGERPLQHIKPIEIQKLYAELTELAPRTRHHIATVLKACFQAAVDIGKLLQVNPAATIKKPTAADSDVGQALEQEKITAPVNGFRGSTLFDLVFVMAFTGMRRGEALALRWSDSTPLRRLCGSNELSNTPRSTGYNSRRPSPSGVSAISFSTMPWSRF